MLFLSEFFWIILLLLLDEVLSESHCFDTNRSFVQEKIITLDYKSYSQTRHRWHNWISCDFVYIWMVKSDLHNWVQLSAPKLKNMCNTHARTHTYIHTDPSPYTHTSIYFIWYDMRLISSSAADLGFPWGALKSGGGGGEWRAPT